MRSAGEIKNHNEKQQLGKKNNQMKRKMKTEALYLLA